MFDRPGCIRPSRKRSPSIRARKSRMDSVICSTTAPCILYWEIRSRGFPDSCGLAGGDPRMRGPSVGGIAAVQCGNERLSWLLVLDSPPSTEGPSEVLIGRHLSRGLCIRGWSHGMNTLSLLSLERAAPAVLPHAASRRLSGLPPRMAGPRWNDRVCVCIGSPSLNGHLVLWPFSSASSSPSCVRVCFFSQLKK
jgi:hypothetical protein